MPRPNRDMEEYDPAEPAPTGPGAGLGGPFLLAAVPFAIFALLVLADRILR